MEDSKPTYFKGDEGVAEADTCRICRGEGDASESLFYPCKCSGSIKYVHQECLMEWLSHSQKKHCELCKTRFRFTKFYQPDMPHSLPLRILARHILIHAYKTIITVLRLCLVVLVWLGFLPYTIRQVWRFLFWLSEGGWPPSDLANSYNSSLNGTLELQQAQTLEISPLTSNKDSLALLPNVDVTNPVNLRTIIDKLIQFLMPVSHALRVNKSDDIITSLFKSIYNKLGIHNSVTRGLALKKANIFTISNSSSLLSEVSLFQNLTHSASINQLVISITEGYIITLLVVVCFILVFLIREWVVQQQPGINMGVGFNAELVPDERPRESEQDPRPRDDTQIGNENVNENEQISPGHTRRRNHDLISPNGSDSSESGRLVLNRNSSAPAADIQRKIADEQWLAAQYLNIWDRCQGDPMQIMINIHIEGRKEQLRNWINIMRTLDDTAETRRRALKILESNPIVEIEDPSDIAYTIYFEGSDGTKSITRPMNQTRVDYPYSSDPDVKSIQNDNTLAPRRTTVAFDKLPNSSRVVYHAFLTESCKVKSESDPQSPASASRSDSPDINYDSSEDESALDIIESEPNDLTRTDECFSKVPKRTFRSTHETSNASHSYCLTESNIVDNDKLPINPTCASLSSSSTADLRFSKGKEKLSDLSSELQQIALKESSEVEENKSLRTGNPLHKEIGIRHNDTSHLSESVRKASLLPLKEDGNQVIESSGSIPTHRTPSSKQKSSKLEVQTKRSDNNLDLNIINEGSENSVALPSNSTSVLAPSEGSIEIDRPEISAPHSEVNLAQIGNPVVGRPARRTIFGAITDYLWGGIDDRLYDNQEANAEETPNLVADPHLAPTATGNNQIDTNAEVDDDEVQVENAVGIDLNDPEAIDDAEDFEGIMELLGMRGPLFSLIQNALFSTLLLGLTITIGVWLPYNIGRVSLLLLANPGPALRVPVKTVLGCASVVQDVILTILGFTFLICIQLFAQPYNLFSLYFGLEQPLIASQTNFFTSAARNISYPAFQRIKNYAMNNILYFTDSEMSAVCHESLIIIRNLVFTFFSKIGKGLVCLFIANNKTVFENIMITLKIFSISAVQFLKSLSGSLTRPDTWMMNFDGKERELPIDLELSDWNSIDRFIAIVAGYIVLCALGTLYVRKRSQLLARQLGRELETAIIDLLSQAGGVLKVILIISIEMLAFPLYCGLLLDISLLPLFENTTITSRIIFTLKSPLTSIFVHWFVGTCYMFHFALFVSMCRKIMRKGVLYFIRDPDDPTFHPVRDVLERNVTTQLQKILFSALVYGGLILVCLGGVVWGISLTLNGVLPVHWSSNEPVLEFPVDLLFYNFLIPFAVKFFKPSAKLHAMYSWWFRKCARFLRLTWFMFDERRLDEERYVVRKSWYDFFRNTQCNPNLVVVEGDPKDVFKFNPNSSAYYRRYGRYVRAPASDQVRIPKGSSIFLEVTEFNERIDQKPDRDDSIYGKESELYTFVYIPPFFRLRIGIFIISIWIFAAITGVGVTIIPLILGRVIFAKIVPLQVHKNDAYAFSIGIYIFGLIFYCILNFRYILTRIRTAHLFDTNIPKKLLNYVLFISTRIARITWTYTAFLLILPTLFAFLIEFYFIVPLHTYLSAEEKHVIHFVQSWTLGLLYVKLTARIILWYDDSRPALSLRAITRNGFLDPDARLATRSFIFPGTLLLSSALLYPWALAKITVSTLLRKSPDKHILAYRYSYPLCLCLCVLALILWRLTRWTKNWKIKIRDEVYLVGEQLHNYGERKQLVSPLIIIKRNETRVV